MLPLPILFPENDVVESERIRGLGRAVRSRAKRRVGWQGWANARVRSMNEIFGKTATSAMQLLSLSRIGSAYRGTSAADCNSTAEAFKEMVSNRVPSRSLPDPGAKMPDGSALLEH